MGGYVCLAVVVLLVIYAILDMQRVCVKRYSFEAKDSLRVLQLSDLHKKTFGKGNVRLIRLIERESPDVIVCTGDLVSRNQTNYSDALNLMEHISKVAKVYYIQGNHELEILYSDYETLIGRLESFGVTLLDNQSVSIAEHTQLWGATIPTPCYHNDDHKYTNLYYYTSSDMHKSLGSPSTERYNVLLAHNPFFFDSYSQWGADLTLCGHVHGGIVRLPLINGLLSPERKLLPKYSGGLYTIGNHSMVVSRGLGKLRLFNPPEVSVITLVGNRL